MSPWSYGKTALDQRSTSKNTWPWRAVNLSPRYGHVILVSGYLVLTGVNEVHGKPRLHVSLFGVVVVRTRPRAIPLALITMRKSTHLFPFLSYISMSLRLAPFGPPELHYDRFLLKPTCSCFSLRKESFGENRLSCRVRRLPLSRVTSFWKQTC